MNLSRCSFRCPRGYLSFPLFCLSPVKRVARLRHQSGAPGRAATCFPSELVTFEKGASEIRIIGSDQIRTWKSQDCIKTFLPLRPQTSKFPKLGFVASFLLSSGFRTATSVGRSLLGRRQSKGVSGTTTRRVPASAPSLEERSKHNLSLFFVPVSTSSRVSRINRLTFISYRIVALLFLPSGFLQRTRSCMTCPYHVDVVFSFVPEDYAPGHQALWLHF